MALAKLKTKISVNDYLEREQYSQIRHEFICGEVYAMEDVSQNHCRITGSIFTALSNHLKNSLSEPYLVSVKVRAKEEVFYYPDILVTCEGEFRNKYFSEEPILIIEVISPSTEQIDRREKLHAYRNMPSIIEYVIVEQEKMEIELHRRQSDGNRITYFFTENDTEFTLESVDLTLQLSEVYRRVTFE